MADFCPSLPAAIVNKQPLEQPPDALEKEHPKRRIPLANEIKLLRAEAWSLIIHDEYVQCLERSEWAVNTP